MRHTRPYRAVLLSTCLALLLPARAEAIPAFARRYGVSCTMCHTTAPRLNAFGETFAANGFEMVPGEPPRDTIATGDPLLRLLERINFAFRIDAYAQATTNQAGGAAALDLETPYGIKLLSGGPIAEKISYYLYFFLSERGEVAGLEDAYLQFTDLGGSGITLMAGQFQASDPLFKRELRLTFEDYQPYRVRVGEVRADLTYDRGLMATMSPWSGGALALLVVNGEGLSAADERRQYDRDSGKNAMLRVSQELGPLRVGAFGYLGVATREGIDDRITMWGPDATLPLGASAELNLQYLRRTDDNPFYAATGERRTAVDAGFAEAVWWPRGPMGRWAVTALYNRVDGDGPVVSLRLGEQADDPGYLRRYESAALGVSYLLQRNVRLMGETTWDLEAERGRFTLGAMAAF